MPVRRACDLCYKRKIQCVIEVAGQPCDWCSNQSKSCTFERVIAQAPRKRTTAHVVEELSLRVKELEGALRAAGPLSDGTSSPSEAPLAPASRDSRPSQHAVSPTFPARTRSELPANRPIEPTYKLSRCQLGNNWYFKGVGILSPRGREWITYGSGENIFLEKFDLFNNPANAISGVVLAPLQRSLPSEDNCRYLSGIFFKSKTAMAFPILDQTLFQQTILRAYVGIESAARVAAEACIWAMLALVSFASEAQSPFESANEARRLLSTIDAFVSIDTLQANMLLWAFNKMKCQCREAAAAFGRSCRLVCDLGGHAPLKRPSVLPQYIPTWDEPSRLHLRKLFWLCYCSDKDSCLRTGRPPLLSYEYCEVGDFAEWQCWDNQPRDISLAIIKERSNRLLGSPRAFQQSEGELLANVRQLDDELEEWRLSIAPPYRPRLSVPPDSLLSVPTSMRAEDRTRIINLQLDYLFTIIHIHTMVRKCGDLEQNLPDDLHSAVESSADLSLEASRSIFRYFEVVIAFWQHESVWIVAHFAPMATMTLFVNILIHPLGNPADTDLQILGSIGEISHKLPTERLSRGEIQHVQEIGDFVMELIRICHSAAWKVKKGEREHDLDIRDS